MGFVMSDVGNISFPGQRRYRSFCFFPRGPDTGDPESLCFWAPMVVMMKAKLDQLVIREIQSSHPSPYRKEKRKKTEGRKEKRPYDRYTGSTTIFSTFPGNGGGQRMKKSCLSPTTME